jgi:hypothetical protein
MKVITNKRSNVGSDRENGTLYVAHDDVEYRFERTFNGFQNDTPYVVITKGNGKPIMNNTDKVWVFDCRNMGLVVLWRGGDSGWCRMED